MNASGHNPCASCGVCCSSYVVNVCGYDAWLISTRQRLSPEQFLVACPQAEPGIDGFLLAPGGLVYGLALDKQGKFQAKQACVFLLRLGGGNDRCGIYAHRPVVCQSYPMAVWSNVVFQRKEALCPPDSWPLVEVVRPAWRTALQRLRLRYDLYAEVVARWNARVATADARDRFSLHEYLSYLMNVYDRLDALEDRLGEAAMERVVAEWPNLPRSAEAPPAFPPLEGLPPWLDYLCKARTVIDSFYPGLPPQRVLPTLPEALLAVPGADQPAEANRGTVFAAGEEQPTETGAAARERPAAAPPGAVLVAPLAQGG